MVIFSDICNGILANLAENAFLKNLNNLHTSPKMTSIIHRSYEKYKIVKVTALLFLWLMTLPGIAQFPEKPYANSHYLTIDSVLLHYRVWNGNLPDPSGHVILIHGFIGSTYCWRMNADALAAEGYRVIAVDLPSFGYSARSLTFNQSQSSRGLLLWHLLDSIDGDRPEKWNICGHSMGGGSAEAMALIRPQQTRSLMIVAGMVFIKNNNIETQFTLLAKQKQYNQIMVSYMERSLITYKSVRNALKKNYRHVPDSTVVMNYLKPLLFEGTAPSVLNVWANAREIMPLNADSLKPIPVMLVWGNKDRTIYLRNGRRFAEKVPHAELIIINRAGHSPMETHPDMFNSIYLSFLKRKM